VHAIVRSTLARPRSAETRVSDAFAAAKRTLWTTLQDARGGPTAAAAKDARNTASKTTTERA
jgi:hypothetical protein